MKKKLFTSWLLLWYFFFSSSLSAGAFDMTNVSLSQISLRDIPRLLGTSVVEVAVREALGSQSICLFCCWLHNCWVAGLTYPVAGRNVFLKSSFIWWVFIEHEAYVRLHYTITMDCHLLSVPCSASLRMGLFFAVTTPILIHSFNERLLSSYYMLGTRDKVQRKTVWSKFLPSFQEERGDKQDALIYRVC